MEVLKPLQAGWEYLAPSKATGIYTPQNQQIALENRPCQKETSIPTIHSQVRTVSFKEGIVLSICFFSMACMDVFGRLEIKTWFAG